jgi:hypothetical protein
VLFLSPQNPKTPGFEFYIISINERTDWRRFRLVERFLKLQST